MENSIHILNAPKIFEFATKCFVLITLSLREFTRLLSPWLNKAGCKTTVSLRFGCDENKHFQDRLNEIFLAYLRREFFLNFSSINKIVFDTHQKKLQNLCSPLKPISHLLVHVYVSFRIIVFEKSDLWKMFMCFG